MINIKIVTETCVKFLIILLFFLHFFSSRNAFLEQYRRENMFSDGLDEFDNARETVKALQDEYAACQGPDYVNWGEQGERDGPGRERLAASSRIHRRSSSTT